MKREYVILKMKIKLLEEESTNDKLQQILGAEERINEESIIPRDYIGSVSQFTRQKLICEILYKLKGGFKFRHKMLIDSGVGINYIREGLIPSRYFEKSTYKVQIANGEDLEVECKIPELHVCIGKTCIPASFLLIKVLRQGVIPENLFLTLIKPFTITERRITSCLNGKRIKFKFASKLEESILNLLKEAIKRKEKFINKLTNEIQNSRI